MSQKATTYVKWSLASVALRDAYTDFTLSSQARIFQKLSKKPGSTSHLMCPAEHLAPCYCGPARIRRACKTWASLDLVQHYAQMVDKDLLRHTSKILPLITYDLRHVSDWGTFPRSTPRKLRVIKSDLCSFTRGLCQVFFKKFIRSSRVIEVFFWGISL